MTENARILLVDDEESIRRGLKIALQRKGFDVETREEGLPALLELKTAMGRGRPYQYVVLDVQLPDINGLQLLEIIKTSYPDLPVLVISGYGNDRMVESVHVRQGSAYLSKPFEVQELLDELARLPAEAVSSRPRQGPCERPMGPLESAFVFLRLQPGADPTAVRERLGRRRGVCYCDAVVGDRDLVLLLQGRDRMNLHDVAFGEIATSPGVGEVELCVTRRPTLCPETWRVVQDFIGAPRRGDGAAVPAERVAWVVLEVDPERQARLFVQLHMLDEVLHCDALEDESRLVLLVRVPGPGPQLAAVPGSIAHLPGVRRTRILPLLAMDPT